MLLLSAREVIEALPMPAFIDVMGDAFVDIAHGNSRVVERQSMPLPGGTGLLMGACSKTMGMIGKQVAVMPGNLEKGMPGTIGALILSDPDTGEPLALMDGTTFTAQRTAAAAGFATRLLARPESRVAALIGTGTQASTQVLALDAILDLEEVRVIGKDPGDAEKFIDQLKSEVRLSMTSGHSAREGVRDADLVVMATNATDPVVEAGWLSPGCHMTAIGSFQDGMCEFSPELARHARVFVESREACMAEAGELIASVKAGFKNYRAWVELGDVITGAEEGRQGAAQITLFKMVGHAVFDLYAARAVFDAAVSKGLGTSWSA